ncbi:MAG: DUF1059 domain-containing protein [Vulcanimicrobiaceae bacterium]
MSDRVYVDCRDYPSEKNCSLYIAGTRDEVLAVATKHAVEAHGHPHNDELVKMLTSAMKPEAVHA